MAFPKAGQECSGYCYSMGNIAEETEHPPGASSGCAWTASAAEWQGSLCKAVSVKKHALPRKTGICVMSAWGVSS